MLKQTEVTITDRGRDLTFRITEMSCINAHRFMVLCAKELLKAGIVNQDFSDEVEMTQAVMQSLFTGGLEKLGNVDPDAVDTLLARLIECCEFKVDKAYTKLTWDNVEMYIEDFTNLYRLAKEALMLHLGFLEDVKQSLIQMSQQASGDQGSSKPAMFLRS